MNDLLKALLSVVTGGIGAYIALLAKDFVDRGTNARAADIEEYKKIRIILTDALVATLESADFLSGMVRARFTDRLNDLRHAYEGGRSLIFHNPRLNVQFVALLKNAEDFQMQVANLTIPEGDPPKVTTRPRADRVYPSDETRKQSGDEAKILDGLAKRLAAACKAFIDDGKRQLRT